MKKHLPLIIVVILIVGVIAYLESKSPSRFKGNASDSIIPVSLDASSTGAIASSTLSASELKKITDDKSKKYERVREISTPDGFINTDPFTLKSLIGNKVVLLDFWTYSCINCQRTLPYLNAWYQKYKDYGLVIVGMQTPEFDFEKNYDNVKKATEKFGVKYPVVLDNDFSTWNAYGNQYWPEHYLIDIDGFVTDRHIGEGGYADTEKMIQGLLKERAKRLGLPDNIPTSIVTDTYSIDAQSPETYFGWARNQFLANGAQQKTGDQTLSIPSKVDSNKLYLGGTWNFQSEFASTKGPAKIIYKYTAKNMYFVAHSEKPITITIIKDGKTAGTITVKDAGLYDIVKDQSSGEHTIELDIPAAGLEAFTFTFG